MEIDVY